jgi:hypothetical protein
MASLPITSILTAILLAAGQVPEVPGPATTSQLVERLRADPLDSTAASKLARRDRAAAIPALRAAFLRAQLTDERRTDPSNPSSLRASQIIALALFAHGVRDQIYLDELTKHVVAIVQDNPPNQYEMDRDGKDDMKSPSSEYLDWCAGHSLTGTACSEAITLYGLDVIALSGVRDPRSVPVLRSLLGLSNSTLVWAAIPALGGLGDDAALPMILAACQRFRPKESQAIGSSVAGFFSSPEALSVAEKCIQDAPTRDNVRKQWLERRERQKLR